MMSVETIESEVDRKHLPHHEQLPLCTTRLPYRQGRKLTAVKVYTINNESNHLLVFGVPLLNLRQETKALFSKFGKLLHFTVSTKHPAEDFTETYHARYERIQSARIAKRMIDTTNFYGGSLHICYAPELETYEETKNKLLQRKKDVWYRLRNLEKEAIEETTCQLNNHNASIHLINNFVANNNQNEHNSIVNEASCSSSKDDRKDESKKMNMGEENVIYFSKTKRKVQNKAIIEKRFKPCFEENGGNKNSNEIVLPNNVKVVDCTSIENNIVSNINDALNYNKFGNEVIRKVDTKPVNRIIFRCNKKS